MPEDMTIGEILQNARLAKGYNYDMIEKETNIRVPYLMALEANEFDKIPGEVFIKGMLRTYGNFVGLDGNELVTQYKSLTTGKSSREVTSKGIREVDNVRMNVRLKEKRDIGSGRDRKGLGIKVSKPEVKIPWRELAAGFTVLAVLAIGYAVIPKAIAYMNRPKPASQVEAKKAEPAKVEAKTEVKHVEPAKDAATIEVKKVEPAKVEAKMTEAAVPTKEQYAPASAALQAVAPAPAQDVQQPVVTKQPVQPAPATNTPSAVEPVVKEAAPAPKVEEKAPVVKQEATKVAPKVENKPLKSK